MTILFSQSGNTKSSREFGSDNPGAGVSRLVNQPMKEEFHILGEKLLIPKCEALLQRPRLNEMIEKSLSQFGATLISGRSGTGKTALAAEFAKNWKTVAWYSVESPDIDWNVFSSYFAASLKALLSDKEFNGVARPKSTNPSKAVMAQFLADIFSRVDADPNREPRLIILDDLHRIFDAPWFGEFFNLLLYSLRENTHLLLLCRSQPPNPLWRLRSKQMLNVIDEKLLAFNAEETAEFFKSFGLPETTARKAHTDSFGRIAKVMQIARREPSEFSL